MTTTEVDNDETTLKKKNDFSLVEEAIKLFHVGLPSVAVQFELYFVFPLAASKVGRLLGTTELAAFSLGSLIGNLTCLSVIVGALTAADTLMPRAYGAENYEEIGRLAVRSVFVCSLLLVPAVVILSQPAIVEFLLQSLRQDEEVSRLTALWMQWFLIGTPANMMFRVIQRFLVAQHKPLPPVYAAFLPSFVIHPLLLSLLVPTMGLTGSALAIACTQWLMLLFLLAFLKVRPVYEKASWPGLSIAFLKDSLMRPRPLFKFLHLGMGGVLSMNEWFFWEVMCFSAGVFGVVELCAHTIAYNIIPLCFMVPLGMSIGLTVRMGSVITNDVDRAKRIAAWTLAFIAFLGAVLGFCLHTFAEPIILLFTNDDAVLQMAKSIWGRVCYYIFVLYIFGINCAILRALAMQWRTAMVLIVSLWCIALPLIIWFAFVQGGGLQAQWTLLPICYTFMQVLLVATYTSVDWGARSARLRHSSVLVVTADDMEDLYSEQLRAASENTPLLHVSSGDKLGHS